MPSTKCRTNHPPAGAVRQYPSSPGTGETSKRQRHSPFTNFTPHKQTIPTSQQFWQLSCLIKWDVGDIKWIYLNIRFTNQILVYWPWKLLYRPFKPIAEYELQGQRIAPPFHVTKRTHVSPQDLVKSRSHEIRCYDRKCQDYVFIMIASLWNSTCNSAALLRRCLQIA